MAPAPSSSWRFRVAALVLLVLAGFVGFPSEVQAQQFVPVGPTALNVDLGSPTFSLRVRLFWTAGSTTIPIPDVDIEWTATSHGGAVTPTLYITPTDSNGEATATFTATAAGRVMIAAATPAGTGLVPVTFTIDISQQTQQFVLEPVGPTELDIDLGTPSFTLRVRLRSASNQPISGASISWSAASAGGAVTPATRTSTTNSNGEATATFTATAAGRVTITATAPADLNANPVTFTIDISQQAQQYLLAPVGPTGLDVDLSAPGFTLQVRLSGSDGAPVSGSDIRWEATHGADLVTPATTSSTTGSTGIAAATFTATGVGAIEIVAVAERGSNRVGYRIVVT
ncbi:MAG: Ig-like domain-containing protein, partial [Thermoanaerobaculia bacterium]|nr:Ig-like domain-containing protein [Thermoanaerobaculia bacterium]